MQRREAEAALAAFIKHVVLGGGRQAVGQLGAPGAVEQQIVAAHQNVFTQLVHGGVDAVAAPAGLEPDHWPPLAAQMRRHGGAMTNQLAIVREIPLPRVFVALLRKQKMILHIDDEKS